MRVIGYLQMRVVGAVTEGLGFEDQERQVRQWAHRCGHDVVRLVADRSSIDGPGPGLSAAVAAVRTGEADALLVNSPGRLGADHPIGVTVLFADRPQPTTPTAPPRRSWRNVRSALGPWAGIAVATAVAAGVAAASVEEPLPATERDCVPVTHQTGPCRATDTPRVVETEPLHGGCGAGDLHYPSPDGASICLFYR